MLNFSCDGYCPVALTPIIRKCFERLVMHHIKSTLSSRIGPLPVCILVQPLDRRCDLHCPPPSPHSPEDQRPTYHNAVHYHFSIQHNHPPTAHPQLELNSSLCNWLLDFLTGRPQAVQVSSNTSRTITLNTRPPKDV